MELRNSKKKGVSAPQAERNRRTKPPDGAQAHASSPNREQHSNKRVRSKTPSDRPSRRQRRGEAGPSTGTREAQATDTPARVDPESHKPSTAVKKELNRRSSGHGSPGGDRAAAMTDNSAGDERDEQVCCAPRIV